MAFIFGEGTPWTYEQLQRKRKIADQLRAGLGHAPQNVGEGLTAIGNALAARGLDKRASKREGVLRDEFDQQLAGIFGGGATPQPQGRPQSAPVPFVPAPDGTALGNDVMDALNKPRNGPDPTLDLIKSFEGFIDAPKWDVNANRLGYGSDTITNPDGSFRKVQPGDRVTREQADLDLQRRVNTEFTPIVKAAIGDGAYSQMDANQRAALTSIAYNYGKIPDTVAAAARSGDKAATAAAISGLGTHNDGINAGRRAQEAQIFSGQPPAPASPQAPDLQQIMSLMSSPLATPAQKAYLGQLLQQQMPQSEMEQIQLEQARIDLDRSRNATPERDVIKGADGFNYYQDTGERVLPGVQQEPEPTTGQRDYDFYSQQERAAGRVPQSFNEWRLSGKRAGASNVTTNVAGGDTKGWEAVDKAFATDIYTPWVLQGGSADSGKLINQLNEASGALASGADLTGPVTGRIPDIVQSWVNPESVAVRERVEEVVQRNLKEVLGAQFTKEEGDRLIARAYNPSLGEAENKRRVDALIRQMVSAADAKSKAVEYFSENGTMRGFKGKMMTARDFEFPEWDREPSPDGADTTGITDTATPKTAADINAMTPEQLNKFIAGADVASLPSEVVDAILARGGQ